MLKANVGVNVSIYPEPANKCGLLGDKVEENSDSFRPD